MINHGLLLVIIHRFQALNSAGQTRNLERETRKKNWKRFAEILSN